jgi:hypothetical protein
MERGSDKVSRRIDDELKRDTEGVVRSGHATHAEEWKGSEPSGEDQPDVDLSPEGTLAGGVPEGLTAADVEGRSELASFIGRAHYPATREQLLALVTSRHAPDHVLDELRTLPDDRSFDTLQDAWTALGGGAEQHRF